MPERPAKKTKKHDQSASTKQRLIDAATNLFANKGYGATSVKDISSAAGISEGSIFWHFESKQGLLFAVVDQALAGWEAEILAPLLEQAAQPGSAAAIVEAHRRFALANPEVGERLFLKLAGEALTPGAPLQSAYQDIYDRFREHGCRWIEASRRAGWIRADVDAAATSTVIVGALAGISLQWCIGGKTMDFDAAHRDLARILERGLAMSADDGAT
jgi:TetR/AcrR family acrAB operon transcriptional repressor